MNDLSPVARLILIVSWPGLFVGTLLILREAFRFSRSTRCPSYGRLVAAMTVGWLASLYLLGFVATTHLIRHGDKDDVWTMAAVFLLSIVIFGALYAGIRRWNRESVELNELHAQLEAQIGGQMGHLEEQNRKLTEVTAQLAHRLGESQSALDAKLKELSDISRMLVTRELRMRELKTKIGKLQLPPPEIGD